MKILSPAGVNQLERMNDPEPSRLISECIAGNEAAIEMLVRQHEADVFRLALSITGDPAEAREITQETFIMALKSLRSYREKGSLKAWLYTITLNLSRSRLRKRKRLERLRTTLAAILRMEAQEQIRPEDAAIQNEKEAAVWSELNKLDERHRIVIVLRYFHDLSVTEIAEILSIREGTIHSRLHNARERLRNALTELHKE